MHRHRPSLEGRHLTPADMTKSPGFVAWNKNPNPTSRLHQFAKAIIVILPILAFIFFCLRTYSRARTRQLRLDDIFISASMVIMVPMTVSSYMFAKTTYIGVYIQDIPWINYVEARRWDYLAQVFYHPILPLVKTSMLLFLLRLGRQKAGMKHAIHTVNALNLAAMFATTFTAMFQCVPIHRYWDHRAKGGCIASIGRFYIAAAAISIFTDVLVLALPFWAFLDLQMARKLKIAVLAVFCFGSLVTVVSVVRLYYFYRLFSESHFEVQRRLRNPDPSYSIAFVVSNLETSLAIMCACVPALRGLARAWFPGGGGGSRDTLTSLTPGPMQGTLEAGWVSRSRRRASDAPPRLPRGAYRSRLGTVGVCCRLEKKRPGPDEGGAAKGMRGPDAGLREAGGVILIGLGSHVPVVPEAAEIEAADDSKSIIRQTHISIRYERQSKTLSEIDSETDSELDVVEDIEDMVQVPPPAKLDEAEDKGMRTCMCSEFPN